jgi:hypothetical protein
VRLVDLHPEWWAPPCRRGVAVVFDCPHCVATAVKHPSCIGAPYGFTRLCCSVTPLDGGAPFLAENDTLLAAGLKPSEMPWCVDSGIVWARTGDTFETLTLSPSVDASRAGGHWHGFISAGAIT